METCLLFLSRGLSRGRMGGPWETGFSSGRGETKLNQVLPLAESEKTGGWGGYLGSHLHVVHFPSK